MKRLLLSSVSFAAALLASLTSSAQHPNWAGKMRQDSTTFESLRNEHRLAWPEAPTLRGQGFKQMERYKALHESRLNDAGKPISGPETIRMWEEMRAFGQERSIAGHWQPLGPILDDVTTRDHIEGVGRMSCLEFHPNDPNTIFAGAPAGGLWRSFDGGQTWSTNTDWLPTLGVASIAFDPINPDIVYIGTGDYDASDAPGMGVMKSTDGGETWAFVNTGIEDKLVPCLRFQPGTNELFACTNQGIFKTNDGGTTWTEISENSNDYEDLEFHPTQPTTMYAVGSGRFYVTYDNGANWDWVTQMLGSSSRMLIAVTPAAPDHVYVLKTSTYEFSGFFKSTDAAASFVEMSDSPNIMGWAADGSSTGGQAWYDLCLTADLETPDVVYVGGIRLKKSIDGGATWLDINPNYVHVDQHYLVMSPHTNELYACNDGGLYRYADNTEWIDISKGIVNGQIYQLAQSPFNPNKTLTGFQDNGTAEYDGVFWKRRGGGDGFECAYDHSDSQWRYGSIYYGDIYRTNSEVVNEKICGNGVNGIDEAGAWNTPYTLGRYDPTGNTLIVGLKNVWRTTNVKEPNKDDIVWTQISDVLGGNNSVDINELEVHMTNPNIMYVSEGTRKLFRTNNALSDTPTWVTLTNDLPFFQTPVNAIETHPTDTNIVYICFHNDVYISHNQGADWELMTGDVPDVPTNTMVMDTSAFGNLALYVGTDMGVLYYDTLQASWTSFSEGLPTNSRITELEIFYGNTPSLHRLKASTYGRGLWESDLYSNEINYFPAVASLSRATESNEVYGTFEVEAIFYRSLDETDMEGFVDLDDISAINASVTAIAGGPSHYTITLTPQSFGEIKLVIPSDKAQDIEYGIGNFASDTLKLYYIAAPEALGPLGPGGVGDASSVAFWLRADMQANGGGDNVGLWMDVIGNGYTAAQNTPSKQPTVVADAINGQAALVFDGDDDCLVMESVVPGRSMSAYTLVEADSIAFNDHGWFASARTENGYLMHPWKNQSYYHGDVYDLNGESSGASGFYIGDGAAPHIYGFIYHQDDLHQVMTQVFDDNTYPHPGVQLGLRDDTTPISEIRIGWDYEERYGKGKIAEHFVYRTRLMESQHQIVNNYLASKYGIDLGPLAKYHHPLQNEEVIGVGRENEFDFHDEAQGKQILRIVNPQSMDAGDYLMIGTDNASMNTVPELYPILSTRVERTWGYSETGDMGAVTLRFNASDLPAVENLGLIITSGNSFVAGGTYTFVPLMIQGPVLEATFDFDGEGVFTIGVEPTVGEEDLSYAEALIYPNPASDQLQIQLKQVLSENWNIVVYNVTGDRVKEVSMSGTQAALSVAELARGMYFVDVMVKGTVINRSKIILE